MRQGRRSADGESLQALFGEVDATTSAAAPRAPRDPRRPRATPCRDGDMRRGAVRAPRPWWPACAARRPSTRWRRRRRRSACRCGAGAPSDGDPGARGAGPGRPCRRLPRHGGAPGAARRRAWWRRRRCRLFSPSGSRARSDRACRCSATSCACRWWRGSGGRGAARSCAPGRSRPRRVARRSAGCTAWVACSLPWTWPGLSPSSPLPESSRRLRPLPRRSAPTRPRPPPPGRSPRIAPGRARPRRRPAGIPRPDGSGGDGRVPARRRGWRLRWSPRRRRRRAAAGHRAAARAPASRPRPRRGGCGRRCSPRCRRGVRARRRRCRPAR